MIDIDKLVALHNHSDAPDAERITIIVHDSGFGKTAQTLAQLRNADLIFTECGGGILVEAKP